MQTDDRNDLKLLGEILVQIRGIAGDAAECGHVSAAGSGVFAPEAALRAIYRLADAAHNVPNALADGPGQGCNFLLPTARKEVCEVGEDLFGASNPFWEHMPLALDR